MTSTKDIKIAVVIEKIERTVFFDSQENSLYLMVFARKFRFVFVPG